MYSYGSSIVFSACPAPVSAHHALPLFPVFFPRSSGNKKNVIFSKCEVFFWIAQCKDKWDIVNLLVSPLIVDANANASEELRGQ